MFMVQRIGTDGRVYTTCTPSSFRDACYEMQKLLHTVANTVCVLVRDKLTGTVHAHEYVSADGRAPSTATGKRFHTPYLSHLRRPCKLQRA